MNNTKEELACNIIDMVSELIEEHYDIVPKCLTDDDIENPALINGTIYYDLEDEVVDKIKEFIEKKEVTQ